MSKRKSEEYPRTNSKRSAQSPLTEQWRELMHRSNETLARGDYELAIDEASTAVRELLRACLVPILDIRAMAHAKGSYFMEGLNDARRMIRYTPESTEGYLRVGALYMMQGKPWEAIQVYEDGLGMVPITHPKYQELVNGIKEAKKQDEKRIDAIAALPNEVLSNVFTRLSTETLAACMNVSTQWRERLARCSEAWRSIDNINSEISTTIPFVASHIRHLHLICSDIVVEQRIVRLLKKGAFRRLETLKLFTGKETLEHMYNTQLPAVLTQTQNTLRFLDLDCSRTNVIQLTTLLSLCPNLTDLSYRNADTPFFSVVPSSIRTTSFVLPKRLNLINLCLWSQQVQPAELEAILCRCLNLRGLVVHKNFMEVAFLLSEQFCTKLETLYVNRLLPLATLSDSHRNSLSPPGMRRFSMCYGDRVEFGAIVPLLRRNSKTLQEFRLELSDYAPDVLRQWHPFSNIVFSRLHTLHCGIGRCTADTVAEIIHQCPALEKFTIVYSNMMVSHNIFDALASLTRLRQLSIFSTDEVSHTGIESFFRRHTERQKNSQLTSLLLTCGKGITDTALASLAKIKNLRAISISNCLDASVNGFNHFAHLLRSSCALETLTLEDIDQVNDTAVERLGVIRSLKWVAFFGLRNVSHEGIIHLIDSSFSLQSISVDHGELATDVILKCAARKGIRIEGI